MPGATGAVDLPRAQAVTAACQALVFSYRHDARAGSSRSGDAERCRRDGSATELQEVAPGRFNAMGRLGPVGGRPHLVLNGHVDVVPAGDGWSLPPFEPIMREGRIYGRGAADMKGGLAALIAAVEAV